jgi:hypothetical protein
MGLEPAIIASIVAQMSPVYVEALKKVLYLQLAKQNIEVKATDKDSLVVEILQKSEDIRGDESPEDSSRSTRHIIQKADTILVSERNRLVPLAAREHWIALIFAVLSGSVFLVAIVLAALGTVQQAAITLIASVIPGFLSRVFFSREAALEDQIAEITSDLRDSEIAIERLRIMEEALILIPDENKSSLAEAFTKKFFK